MSKRTTPAPEPPLPTSPLLDHYARQVLCLWCAGLLTEAELATVATRIEGRQKEIANAKPPEGRQP